MTKRKMYSYEVVVRATVQVENAEDETEAAEMAKFAIEMGNDVVHTAVEDIRKIG